MKRLLAWSVAALAVLGVAVAAYGFKQLASDPAPAAEANAPVVQVRTELPREQALNDTLTAFGEVAPGQVSGVSFARAGQITRLALLPGQRVAKGAVLATLSPDPAAQQVYAQAVTAAGLARREWDRLQQLLALRLATQSQVDSAEKAFRDATGNVKALDQQGGGAAASTLTAPFDGVVTSIAVAQGDRIAAGAPVLQLGRADALRVQIGIDPAESRRVHVGTPVTLVPIVGPSATPEPIKASVAEVQDVVDAKTQLVSAIAVLQRAESGQLVAGMKVRATLALGTRTAIAVPRNAVLSDARGDYVYQVDAGKAHRVGVTQQLESGGRVAIAGLSQLQWPVVIEGNYELQDGMAVKEAAR